MALQYKPHLLQLSDDVILYIMSFLSARDVFVMGQVCTRLEKISRDRTLWRRADFRPEILTLQELKRAAAFFTEQTDFLAIRGSLKQSPATGNWKTEHLTPALFKLIKKQAPNLRTLVLDEHYMDANKLEFPNFPNSLTRLEIKESELVNMPLKQSYFFNISAIMPNLEVLVLDGCKWLEDHSLMAISKCPKLARLSTRGCIRIGTCAAYICLAARFGFERLESIDLRETMVGDGELLALQFRQMLKELYVDGGLHRKKQSHEFDHVTDRSIYGLVSNIPNLEALVLTNTEITDSTLRHIARNLPGLKILDVRGSKVTEEGVLQLRKSLKNLKILCDFPALCDEVSEIDKCWLVEQDFVKVEELPRPPPSSASEAAPDLLPEAAGPTVEISFVEPGVVRLRRIAPEVQQENIPRAPIVRESNENHEEPQPHCSREKNEVDEDQE